MLKNTKIIDDALKNARWIKRAEFEDSKQYVENLFKSNDINYQNGKIFVKNNDKELRNKCEVLINKLKGLKGLLAVQIIFGYGSNNGFNFIFAGNKVNAKFGYHITEKKNLEKIKKNGLIPSFPHEQSDSFGLSFIKFKRLYKAIFLAPTKSSIPTYIAFQKPVIIKFDLRTVDCYEDQLGSIDYNKKSIVCFDQILPQNILDIIIMK